MNNRHESFLAPFFKEMNTEFQDKWCVLHSYETLPFYSVSDVDMAFSAANIDALEVLIKRIAKATDWTLLQKLWYDVQNCYYYVLRHAATDTLLAIDFLIDNDGIGKYGFTTEALTQNCVLTNAGFPIPNPETALCYKLVKRIVKNRSVEEDKAYLAALYLDSDHEKLTQILKQQFGRQTIEPILAYLDDKTKTLNKQDIILLRNSRKKTISAFGKRLKYGYWELRRTCNRLLFPSGLLISVPDMSEAQLAIFSKALESKVGIMFRFVRLNTSKSKLVNSKGFVGSTLVICPEQKLNQRKVITATWFSNAAVDLESISWENDLEGLANQYFSAIIDNLSARMQNKRMADGS